MKINKIVVSTKYLTINKFTISLLFQFSNVFFILNFSEYNNILKCNVYCFYMYTYLPLYSSESYYVYFVYLDIF